MAELSVNGAVDHPITHSDGKTNGVNHSTEPVMIFKNLDTGEVFELPPEPTFTLLPPTPNRPSLSNVPSSSPQQPQPKTHSSSTPPPRQNGESLFPRSSDARPALQKPLQPPQSQPSQPLQQSQSQPSQPSHQSQPSQPSQPSHQSQPSQPSALRKLFSFGSKPPIPAPVAPAPHPVAPSIVKPRLITTDSKRRLLTPKEKQRSSVLVQHFSAMATNSRKDSTATFHNGGKQVLIEDSLSFKDFEKLWQERYSDSCVTDALPVPSRFVMALPWKQEASGKVLHMHSLFARDCGDLTVNGVAVPDEQDERERAFSVYRMLYESTGNNESLLRQITMFTNHTLALYLHDTLLAYFPEDGSYIVRQSFSPRELEVTANFAVTRVCANAVFDVLCVNEGCDTVSLNCKGTVMLDFGKRSVYTSFSKPFTRQNGSSESDEEDNS